ncbi:porin [Paraburkholderia pallida]|uniref:Porin n=1 Tax=Paraburkholderia pallida TaxID=2547399 RepID=A0A4P7CY91_9BURK|nr:porin [Paraburkholderia pallida]QBQ99786.1 porin [Paraburkholderia pallida]
MTTKHLKIGIGAMLIGASACSHAQSSVDLYGLIDAGITYVSNQGGQSLVKFADGINFGNRVGFMGTEDLGGGYKAVFKLENGFSLGTGALGQGGAMFGRQAYVGLGNAYGTLTLGNQYDFVFDYMTEFSATGYAFATGGHMGDVDRQGGDRLNNAVKFSSNSFGGLRFGAMYSFGGVAGSLHENSAFSAGLRYDGDKLSMAAVYTQLNNPHGIAGLDPYNQLGVFTFLNQTVAVRNPATGAVTDLYPYGNAFPVDRQSMTELGASYKLGKLTVTGNITATQFKGYGTSETLWVYEVGGLYSVTPELLGIVGYQYEKMDNVHWNQPTVGLYYFLSKRTSFYAAASYLFASGPLVATQGQGFFNDPSSNHEQASARIGIIHKF